MYLLNFKERVFFDRKSRVCTDCHLNMHEQAQCQNSIFLLRQVCVEDEEVVVANDAVFSFHTNCFFFLTSGKTKKNTPQMSAVSR